MSHNPTYDPEPGSYYSGGGGSGHSTPRQFYSGSTLPVADSGPYTNMASYRQATAGPPTNTTTDPPAGNGKSYRFATSETIPEDDGAGSPVADSRQVQFTDLGSGTKNPEKNWNSSGGQSSGSSDSKFMILAAVAAVFALLFIIFLALFIWRSANPVMSTGEGTTVAGPDPIKEEPTTGANPSTDQPKTTAAGPTTTVPPPSNIAEKSLGNWAGTEVFQYTLENDNGVMADILSLGARFNMLKKNTVILMKGMDTDTGNLTAIAEDTDGAWHGPVCGKTLTLHQKHFTKMDTTDGSLRLETKINDIDVAFMYKLGNDDVLNVRITGVSTSSAPKPIDICSSNEFKLGDSENIYDHQLQIPADDRYKPSGWGGNSGISDFRTLTGVRNTIDVTLRDVDPEAEALEYVYLLNGPIGMRHAATVAAPSNTQTKVMLQTNQPVLKMYINLKDQQYIKLIARIAWQEDGEPDQSKVELEMGSIYEFSMNYIVQ